MYLEEHGYLDITNQLHLFALHYVYLPRINRPFVAFYKRMGYAPAIYRGK